MVMAPRASRFPCGHAGIVTAAMVTPDLTSTARGATFPCFDGLRAIAALSVAITHSAFISGFNVRSSGWGAITARMDIGVAVFFVISGFLLYRPFVAARLAGAPGPGVASFARRRILRIFPAYWLVLTTVYVVPQLRGIGFDDFSADNVVAHYLLLHTYDIGFGLVPVQQAWTLVTELAFYALLPLYAAVLARRRSTRAQMLRDEFLALGALFVVGLLSRTFVLFAIDHPGWRGFSNLWLPARLDHFAFGMLLAVLSVWHRELGAEPRWSRHWSLPWISWGVSGATFVYLSIGFGLDEHRAQANFSQTQEWWLLFLWGVVGVTAVAPAVFGPQDRGVIRRFLRFGPVAWLGVVSYGIYLWHEAALDLFLRWRDLDLPNSFPEPYHFGLMTLFMLAVSIPLAAVSYYLVERPALSLKNRPVRDWFRGSRRKAVA